MQQTKVISHVTRDVTVATRVFPHDLCLLLFMIILVISTFPSASSVCL